MAFGTLTRFDTLATAYNTTVSQFGEDLAWQAIQDLLTAHNQQLAESMGDFVESTTDRLRRYGGPDSMSMEELDEFGTPDAQKISAGETVAFPLKFYGIALQWTRLFFQNAKASELAAQVTAATDADVKAIQREMKKALFTKTSYTFLDRRVDGVSLGVKALMNADSSDIPVAPDGTTFDGTTHTHYKGATAAAWTGSTAANKLTDIVDLYDNVLEHFLGGQIYIFINRAQEAGFRTITTFNPYIDSRLIMGAGNTGLVARGTLDMTNITNRAIGVVGPAEVWVKPWIPTGYIIALHVGSGGRPLVRRTRDGGGGNLELLFENETYPLRARALGREFGFGVYNRLAAACLDTTSVGATLAAYTSPTIV
jgi:hypothetical protein